MDQIHYLTFYYSTGSMQFSSVNYMLKEIDGKYSVFISPDGDNPENAFMKIVDKGFVKKVLDVLKKHKVGYWNGFNKNNKLVMDGKGFSLNVRFHSGKAIHAHGYMRWPKNYKEVRSELDSLFMSLYNKY